MHRGALDAVLLTPLVVDESLFEAAACGGVSLRRGRMGRGAGKEELTGFEDRGEVEGDLGVVGLEGGRDATAQAQ